jgi:hypothetical protein
MFIAVPQKQKLHERSSKLGLYYFVATDSYHNSFDIPRSDECVTETSHGTVTLTVDMLPAHL